VYVAIEPATGNSFCLYLPRVDSECLQIFAQRFGEYVAGKRVGLVMDGSGAHKSTRVVWPAQVLTVSLPPYSPELNPVELVFRHLRARLSNRVFEDLDELEAALTQALLGTPRGTTQPDWLSVVAPGCPSYHATSSMKEYNGSLLD
jgi:transposase